MNSVSNDINDDCWGHWPDTLGDPKATINRPLLHESCDTTSAVLCGLCYALGCLLIVAALCVRAWRA